MDSYVKYQGSITRIGIIGGSFDPIHIGHLSIADSARIKYNLQKIIFVPSYCPPHKSRIVLAPFEHRCRMIELAIEKNSLFSISYVERRECCPSYAGVTVKELKAEYGSEHVYYFIIGLDALPTITDPEKSRTYPGLCYFIATTRPGFHWSTMEKQISEKFRPYILINEIPAIAVSSTDIKYRIRSNQSIDNMVPDSVKEYIYKFKVYTQCFT